MKLEVSLFRFDHKSDYLPYYTKNFLKVKNEKNLLDILNNINNENPFEYRNSNNFCVAINGKYTNVEISIEELVEKFGNDLIIEPLSIRRAHTDLLINDDDFKERLETFSKILENNLTLDDEDIIKYRSYKIYFYASNTINYEYDYIGDSLLLLACDLIEKNKDKEEIILKALSQFECGAQFHTSLENRVLNIDPNIEKRIKELKIKLDLSKEIENKNLIDFGTFENIKNKKDIKYNFNEFKIAYFEGLNKDPHTKELLSKLDAKILNLPSMNIDLALDSFHLNSKFTFKLASNAILDAFDNDADLLLVDDEVIFDIFDKNRKILEEISGRDIVLPVIYKNELAKLAIGSHDDVRKSLDKHLISLDII